MAEFYSGFVVIMESDVNEEDSQSLMGAIKMIKGVVDVKPITKEPNEKRVERSRLKGELRKSINDFLDKV